MSRKELLIDWDDAESDILYSFLRELARTHTDSNKELGIALAKAYMSLPIGKQYEGDLDE